MINKYRLSIVVPCWGRPARTRRIINNILSQDIKGWEAFVIGDGCPIFQSLIDSGEAYFYAKLAEEKGNKLHIFNNPERQGQWGQPIVNYAIEKAQGKYFIFAGNDDILAPTHFKHYLSEIEDTDYDMVAYRSVILPEKKFRIPEFKICNIGHSEIIVKTSTLRLSGQPIGSEIHDWGQIDLILNSTSKVKIAQSQDATYIVTSLNSQQTNESFKTDIID
jgi:glycosyltransferase involved in cell wall biosynthesis